MYESETFDTILNRLINIVHTSEPNLDTRETSVIYNAIAPAAVELAQMYVALDNVLNMTFADMAPRDYLIRRAAERGVIPKPATFAVVQGTFLPSSVDIPIGTRFNCGALNYAITTKIDDGLYNLTCETAGIAGSAQTGSMTAIDNIAGLTSASITSVVVQGRDEEDTEVFRKRYFDTLLTLSYGGNVTDYITRTNSLAGIGGSKCVPVWDGAGTVKLIIMDSTYGAPDNDLINYVKNAADPVVGTGTGKGFAPIGHTVTVVGVVEVMLDITMTLTYSAGYTWDDVSESICDAIDAYYLELAQSWQSESNLVVRISQIESRVLDITGIIDITDTTIETQAANYTLESDEIPVRGTVSENE